MRWASQQLPSRALPLALAVLVFVGLYEQAAFGTAIWSAAAALLWWGLLLTLILGLRGRPLTGAGAACVALLTAFAAFTALSAAWASGIETPVLSATRDLLYVGVLFAVLRFARPAAIGDWCDGIGAGLVAIELVALASRFFSEAFPASASAPVLPDAYTRLSYPVGYWNGLASAAALSVPLILRRSIDRRGATALAAFPVPLTIAYLASSRTGVIAIGIAIVVFVLLNRERAAVTAAIAGTIPALGAIAVISRIHAVVDGPFRTHAATSGGLVATLVVIAAGAAAVAIFGWARPRLDAVRIPRGTGRAALGVVVALIAIGFALSHPVRRWQSFTQPPPTFTNSGYIQSHFLSTNGNWRYQFWRSAFHEFESRPLGGRGAGSFTTWWEEHGPGFVANPHSLYIEALGELGIVGFVLIVGTFAVGLIAGAAAARKLSRPARAGSAAAVAAFAAYVVGAGVDWLWQLPALTAVAVGLLGLALVSRSPEEKPSATPLLLRSSALGLAALVCALVAADVKAGNWLVASSRAAAGRGDLSGAAASARIATHVTPWAASAQLQLALVEEERGRLPEAENAIRGALQHETGSWQLYYVAARIQTKRGERAASARSLARARRLNPHGSLATPGG